MTMTRREFIAAATAASGAMVAGCAGTATPPAGRRYAKVIDAHTHWYPQEFVDLLVKEGEANGAKMGRDPDGHPMVVSVPGGTQRS